MGKSKRFSVVTGANSGLGLETARALVQAGDHVVLACRSLEKARVAKDDILRGASGTAEIVELDLADLASVRRAASEIRAKTKSIDLLINNAGVMAIPRTLTKDGFETQFGANHLGHFVLTAELVAPLLAAEAARVVSVSSIAHVGGSIRFDDPNFERFYFRWSAYCQSKLANLLFATELDRRFRRTGARAIANACHPGMSATNLQFVAARMEGSSLAERFWKLSNDLLAQSAADGAKPTLYAATSPDAVGGGYYGPDGLFETRGEAAKAWVSWQARSQSDAERLWTLSEQMTGTTFTVG